MSFVLLGSSSGQSFELPRMRRSVYGQSAYEENGSLPDSLQSSVLWLVFNFIRDFVMTDTVPNLKRNSPCSSDNTRLKGQGKRLS